MTSPLYLWLCVAFIGIGVGLSEKSWRDGACVTAFAGAIAAFVLMIGKMLQ